MKIAVTGIANSINALETINSLLAVSDELGGDTRLWLLGRGTLTEEDILAAGIERVVWANSAALDLNEPDFMVSILSKLYRIWKPDVILIPSGLLGNELAVRLGLILGCGSITQANDVMLEDEAIIVEKSVYSMNLKAKFRIDSSPAIISMSAPTADRKASQLTPVIEVISDGADCTPPGWFCDIEDEQARMEDSIRTASVVIVGGRGVGSRENTQKLERLAELLNGKVGGTRPVIYDGWLPLDRMIGASAAMLAPKLCLAFGVSGAAAFMAGVEKSSMLVSVNNDPDALIFNASDVGITDDCLKIAEALTEIIEQQRGTR